MKHRTSLYLELLKAPQVGCNCPLIWTDWLTFTQLESTEATLFQMYFFHKSYFTQWVKYKGYTVTSILFQATIRQISLNQPGLHTSLLCRRRQFTTAWFLLSMKCLHYLHKPQRLKTGVLRLEGRDTPDKSFNGSKEVGTGCTDKKSKTSNGVSKPAYTELTK